MKTYPHATPDGIIELVEKSQYDAVVSELEQEVRDNTDLRQRSHEKSVEITKLHADLSRYSAEREHNGMQARLLPSLAERLANEIDCLNHVIGLNPLAGNKLAMQESFDSARKALAAYESAKSGNLTDPLAEAVKRMEEVLIRDLGLVYLKGGAGHYTDEGIGFLRARLISAAKGEQP